MGLSNVKESYRPTEWTQRETYYKEQLENLVIDSDITPAGIKDLISRIDAIFGEARMDLAYVERKLDSLERQKKLYEKELYLIIKNLNMAGVKTVDEVSGAVATAMRSISATDALVDKPIDNADKQRMISDITAALTNSPSTTSTPQGYVTLFQALKTASERKEFMKSVMDILQQKSSAIIADEGAMKIELAIGAQN